MGILLAQKTDGCLCQSIIKKITQIFPHTISSSPLAIIVHRIVCFAGDANNGPDRRCVFEHAHLSFKKQFRCATIAVKQWETLLHCLRAVERTIAASFLSDQDSLKVTQGHVNRREYHPPTPNALTFYPAYGAWTFSH